jgi:NAD(P)-dependent dehydrogenase (short-subunit alcohol dehydrogenase family)
VVVTGGGGAIGTAVRRRFAALGDIVVGLDLVGTPAVEAEADLSGEAAGAAGAGTVLICDVRDESAVESAFAAIRGRHADPTVLVHCAGITGRGALLDETPDEWRRIIDVNLTSAYLVARAAIPGMRRQGEGRIALVASVTGRFGGSALSGPAYAASKGGLLTLSRFIAREHAADGIRCNAVAPGPHDTPMWEALDPERRRGMLAMLPGGQAAGRVTAPGDPADLAAAIVFLCSDEARYITGATLDVNGGQWMG